MTLGPELEMKPEMELEPDPSSSQRLKGYVILEELVTPIGNILTAFKVLSLKSQRVSKIRDTSLYPEMNRRLCLGCRSLNVCKRSLLTFLVRKKKGEEEEEEEEVRQ